MTFSPDKSPDRITPGKALEPSSGTTPQKAPTKDFQSFMQGESPSAARGQVSQASKTPSPAEITRGTTFQTAGPSFDSILAQAKTARDSLGTVETQLKEPNLKLKRSQTHLIKNKLTDANEYIRAAAGKVGVNGAPMKTPSGGSPLERFLAYVNDGQDQLVQVQQKLKELSAKGQQLNAADMLAVTVKMNLAQQEIEYSSTLLGKVIDSIKQMINVQL